MTPELRAKKLYARAERHINHLKDVKVLAMYLAELLMEHSMEIQSKYPELSFNNDIRFLEELKKEIWKL